jgi:hypothetical protein
MAEIVDLFPPAKAEVSSAIKSLAYAGLQERTRKDNASNTSCFICVKRGPSQFLVNLDQTFWLANIVAKIKKPLVASDRHSG